MFEVNELANGLECRFSAVLSQIDRADELLTAFLENRQVAVDAFAMRILLREALLNAITHGSGDDPAKQVTMTVTLEAEGVELVVQDDGAGFTWQSRDCALDVEGDGGRGIPIMQIYSDTMYYNQAGNRVTLSRLYTPSTTASVTQDGDES